MKRLLLILILNYSFLTLNCYAQQYGWFVIDPASIIGAPDFSDLYFTDDNTGWISSSSINNVFKTTDGGLTFTTQNTTLTTNAIHMLNATEGYCGGASGFVYRTTDGGANWYFHGTIANTLIDISFPPTSGTGYACGFDGVIYSVTSAGVTAMTSGVPDNLDCISFPINSTEGWVCGGGNVIRHYTSGAWIGDQVNITGSWYAINFIDNLNGWVVGNRIKHTTNGTNWADQTNPDTLDRAMLDVFFLNTNEGWIVGNQGLILHTTNGGTNWTVEANGLSSALLTGVHFTSSTNGYVIGNNKTLLKFTQLTDVEEQPTQVAEFRLEQNYPNPFNPSTKISWQSPVSGWQTLRIYDVLGNEVVTLVDEYKPAGSYEVDFNAQQTTNNKQLSSGIYFYHLKSGSFFQTKKMILIK